jgi:hypothetical protein
LKGALKAVTQRQIEKAKKKDRETMSEPDELYTLRAQFWLGHYQMALDEARSIMRRPMSPDLKAEREEIIARCYIAMKDYDKVISGDTSGKSKQCTVLFVEKNGYEKLDTAPTH